MTGVDPTLEGAVRVEMRRLRARPERARSHPDWPRALAQSLQHGQRGLLMRLRRVAESASVLYRPVASLRHALDAHPSARELAAAGLLRAGFVAIRPLAGAEHPQGGMEGRRPAQAIAGAPRTEGKIARVLARAGLADPLRSGAGHAGRLPAPTPPHELGLLR